MKSNKIIRLFYVFLDISGVLLGIFLIWLGIQMTREIIFPKELGIIVLVLGICAFLIHFGHYYNLKLRWLVLGPRDYFSTHKKGQF